MWALVPIVTEKIASAPSDSVVEYTMQGIKKQKIEHITRRIIGITL